MKITLGSKTLLEKLTVLHGVISSKSTMPILENFHFKVNGDQLKITSSDLETTMSTTLTVESDGNCNIAVPAKMLIDILKSFPEQPLVFNFADNSIIEIHSASGDYAIAYQNGKEFPALYEVEDPKEITLSSKVLANAIGKTLFATGTDDLRPVMSGVFFQLSSDRFNFVATDAHKLVKYSITDIKSEDTSEFIVPKKPLGILKTALGNTDQEVKMAFNAINVTFQMPDYTLNSRLIDGKYPNYEAVIPKENPNKMTVDRIQFLNAVKCVSLFANKTTHQVKLGIIGNELNLSAEDVDYSNKAEERLTCNYIGEDLTIGFNSRFLTEMLSTIGSDNILLEMSMPNRAGIITPVEGLAEGENLLMLVMPVMIKD